LAVVLCLAQTASHNAGIRITVTWKDGTEHGIDLTGWFSGSLLFAPLLADDALFVTVRVGEWGSALHWTDDLETPDDVLWALGLEQEATRFRDWRKARSLTQEQAAAELGISTRMLAYYEAGSHPIPKTVTPLPAMVSMGVQVRPAGGLAVRRPSRSGYPACRRQRSGDFGLKIPTPGVRARAGSKPQKEKRKPLFSSTFRAISMHGCGRFAGIETGINGLFAVNLGLPGDEKVRVSAGCDTLRQKISFCDTLGHRGKISRIHAGCGGIS